VLESVGRVIEYWGFKRNHGRLWALLYILDAPMSATELGRRLGLSKGAVSMVVRELESWSVVRRVPARSRSGVAYVAERDLWLMLETVLRQRESRMVAQVREDLENAEKEAAADKSLPPGERRAVAGRIRALRRFAQAAGVALEAFIASRNLDVRPLTKILLAPLRRRA